MRRSLLHALAAALVLPAAAQAQDIGPALDPGLMVGWSAGEAVLADLRAKGHGEGGAAEPHAARSVSPAALTYRPSIALRKANFARFVEKARAADPENAAALHTMLQTEDIMAIADKWMAPYGLVSSNVADAAAVYLTTAWLATRGSTADPDQATMRAVRGQVAAAMRATPGFASAGDAQKQQFAESMIVQSLLVAKFVEAAKARTGTQPELMARVGNAAATGARRSFGFDLRNMELTSNGLEKVR